MNTQDIFSLCKSDGTSGDEAALESLLKNHIPSLQRDNLGSYTAVFNLDGKIKLMLDAHLDRVGYIVTGTDDGGFLRVAKVGGADLRTSIGATVRVFTQQGEIFGVVCSVPPHLKKSGESSEVSLGDIAVDIGMTKEEAEKIIFPGDRIVLLESAAELLNGNISVSALDDRAGVVSLIDCVKNVSDRLNNVCVCLALTCREEVGGSGAKAAAFAFEPDYCVCVDAGFGSDSNTAGDETIALGNGPSIGVSSTLDNNFKNILVTLAKQNDIPYQHDVMAGRTGTNADSISNVKSGVKTALLSIPVRNMHTQVEVANLKDIANTTKLIEALVDYLEAGNVI